MGLSNSLPNSILQPGVCTSTTRPASPYEGQVIFETDTNSTLSWSGTAWVAVSDDDTLHIDTTNNRVGIGTTSPDRGLHVDSPTAAVSAKFTSQHASLGLVELADSSSTATSQIGTNGDDMVFRPIQAERMRIASNGNVGIGTTSPSTLLHVTSGTSGDAEVRIAADTDNNAEGDLPYLTFAADGGILEGVVGLNDNTLVLANSVTSGQGIEFRTGATNYYTNGADVVANTTRRMLIDLNGRVTMPYQPAFWVEHVSNALALTANVTTIVPWNTENYDIGNNISSGRFTAPLDGWYSFHTQLLVSKSTATRIDLKFLINGSNSWVNEFQGLTSASNNRTVNGSCILYLNSLDYVEVAVTNVGVNGSLYANTQSVFHHFAGYMLG